jgi:hypothetical protein
MQFLSLFTSSLPPAPPSPEHMAQMGEMIDRSMKAGTLISTDALMNRSTGMLVTFKDGEFDVQDGEVPNSSLMPAGGWAILQGPSREAVLSGIKEFLEMVGDGKCELIQIMEMG